MNNAFDFVFASNYEYLDVLEDLEPIERVTRMPRIFPTRRNYYEEYDAKAFKTRFRLSKESTMAVLSLIENKLEYPNDNMPTFTYSSVPLVYRMAHLMYDSLGLSNQLRQTNLQCGYPATDHWLGNQICFTSSPLQTTPISFGDNNQLTGLSETKENIFKDASPDHFGEFCRCRSLDVRRICGAWHSGLLLKLPATRMSPSFGKLAVLAPRSYLRGLVPFWQRAPGKVPLVVPIFSLHQEGTYTPKPSTRDYYVDGNHTSTIRQR
ncbi:hypothetical protein ACJJTC_004382 [Scirpophaga incertulas]